MKSLSQFVIGVISFALTIAGTGYAETLPESLAWQTELHIVYLDPSVSTITRLSAHGVLAAMIPNADYDPPNEIIARSFPSFDVFRRMLARLTGELSPPKEESKLDTRIVFIFSRVDGFKAILAANAGGQFEWDNISKPPPTIEEQKMLWGLLPYNVVKDFPGPFEKEARSSK